MKWNKFTIKITTEAEDLVSNMLLEQGIEGVEIEDNVPLTEEEVRTMFIDILPVLPPDDGIGYVSFYIKEEEDKEEILKNVVIELDKLREFMDIGEGTIAESVTEDKDWINNWKQFFEPFEVDDILIKPTWVDMVKPEGKLMIEIDPGVAFGTGKHETTQLCIKQLKKYITRTSKFLDVGCGSGILSIIALKLGAELGVGIDIDPNAIAATYENMKVNHMESSKLQVLAGNLLEDTGFEEIIGLEKYDIVVANILADVIIPLSGIIPSYLKEGGIFISSGIINTKEEAVVKAMKKNNLEIIEIDHQGEWVSVTVRKN